MSQPDEMISTATAALLLHKTRMQIRYLIRTGLLQARRQGGRWLIERNSVDALRREWEIDACQQRR